MESKRGAQFTTWQWTYDHDGLTLGHYFGNDYAAAKQDFCFPCTKESREQFNAAVMKAYEQTLTRTQQQAESPAHQQTQAMSGQSM